MAAQEIEQQLRREFGIPASVSMEWAIIVETTGGETLYLPAMTLGEGQLALNICRREFTTEHQVLGCRREIRHAECEDDEEGVTLRSDSNEAASLTLDELQELSFTHYFSPDLLLRAQREHIF